jgi:hypothetical protein
MFSSFVEVVLKMVGPLGERPDPGVMRIRITESICTNIHCSLIMGYIRHYENCLWGLKNTGTVLAISEIAEIGGSDKAARPGGVTDQCAPH